MRKLVGLIAAVAMVSACKQDDAGEKAKSPPVGARTDAAVPVPSAPIDATRPADSAEDVFRKGKKTGLVAADEKPEVVTEALVLAIAAGSFEPSRIIDPAFGVFQLVSLPGARERPDPDEHERNCGKRADKIVVDYAKQMKKHQEQGKEYEDYVIYCRNEWLAEEDPEFGGVAEGEPVRAPHPLRYAQCSSGSAGEWASEYMLLFVPDETRGVRIAGIFVSESGANSEQPFADFADEIAKPKPCK